MHRSSSAILAKAAFLLLLAAGHLMAQTPYPDAKDEAAWPGKGPIRYFGWMAENRKSFWANREKDRGKIVFAGDSTIGGWKLEKDFSGKPVANRGIGGDVTRGLLFRLEEDVLDLKPKAIVLEIGSNDITADAPVATVVANYNLILDRIRNVAPETPVIILALLPHGIPSGPKAPDEGLAAYLRKVNARLPLVNQELAKIPAGRKHVTFVDVYTPFLLPGGEMDESQFGDDKVHLTDAGHTKLAGIVGKVLVDLKVF